MKKKTIYIVIELKVREIVAKLLFSYYASLRGYRIYLGSREKIIDLINDKKEKGGIFFYKAGLQIVRTKKISKKIDKHIVLDEEMTAGLNEERYYKSAKAFFPETKKYIDAYFYVNKKIAKIVAKTIKAKNVYGIGWPRVDLFQKKFSKIYDNDVKKIKGKHGKFYLFMSDLGFITKNYREYALEYTPWGGNKKDIEEWKNFSIAKAKNAVEEFNLLINFFIKICSKNPKIKILIRGHPAENVKEWKKRIKGYKNLIYLPPIDDPQPWIMASKGVLHRGCSTSLQSYVLKKSIAYVKLNFTSRYSPFLKRKPFDISYKIFNVSDFFKWIKIKKNNNLNLVKKDLNLYNSKTSCEKILDIIDKFNIKKENNYIFKQNKTTIREYFLFYFKELKRMIYFLLVISKILKRNVDKFYLTSKIPNGITKKEAIKYLRKIDLRVKNVKSKLKVSEISEDLIKIEMIK